MSNCPVCEKAGLQDFRSQPVICPQCNSDLKPYMVLFRLQSQHKPVNKYIVGTLGFIVLILSMAIVIFLIKVNPTKLEASLIKPEKETSSTDSIAELRKELHRLNEQLQNNQAVVRYKIRRGDYPAKIATFFFNDWTRYRQIEKDNNLIKPYHLRVGQVLIIKLDN